MTSMHFARIIPYEKVCGMLPGYKLMKKVSAARTIMRNSKPALAAVHIGWCLKNWFNGSHLSENYNTIKSISREKYDSYIGRLEQRISKEKGIIFLFANNKRSAVKWVCTLDTKALFVLIGTTSFNPVPSIPQHTTRELRWQTLAFTLRNLGVSSLELAGELDYKVMSNSFMNCKVTETPTGCVNIARDNLAPFIPVDKNESLTFPGNVLMDNFGIVMSEW